MLIRNNITPIYINKYSNKVNYQTKKEEKPLKTDNYLSYFPIFTSNIRHIQTLKDTAITPVFKITRSPNTNNLNKKFQISDEEAKSLILEAQKKAQLNEDKEYAKYTKGYHGVAALLRNNDLDKKTKIISDTNLELNKAITECGERRIISRLKYEDKMDNIIAIAISKSDFSGQCNDTIAPCSICTSWFAELYQQNPNFKHLQFVLPEKIEGNKYNLNILTIEDLLPQLNNKIPSYSKKDIQKLATENNIEYSINALEQQTKLNTDELTSILQKAKNAFNLSKASIGNEDNLMFIKPKNQSEEPVAIGAAVLTESGEIFIGCGMGPKARINVSADQVAIINANMNKKDSSKIKALAIFSEKDASLPSIANMSWLLYNKYISQDFKIIKIENDKIKIYTTKDFMPFAYKG